jgi:hypothetical protein
LEEEPIYKTRLIRVNNPEQIIKPGQQLKKFQKKPDVEKLQGTIILEEKILQYTTNYGILSHT